MEVTDTLVLEVSDASQISEARRRIVKLSTDVGLEQSVRDRIALVVTELGTNLIKHSVHGGKFLVHTLTNPEYSTVEIFSVDNGPGMNIAECIEDGYSTSKTSGNGLGATKRVADDFDAYSQPGIGSVIGVRFCSKGSKYKRLGWGGVCVPKPGEILSGDKWVVHTIQDGVACLVVDGLGHGFEASEASKLACRRFKENLSLPPHEILRALHMALRGSRGAVGAVAKINFEKGVLEFCGLGNISATVSLGTNHKHLTSLNGTLGYEARKFLPVTNLWTNDSVLVMHSDGLASTATSNLESSKAMSAPLYAAWLYKNFGKTTDDATVVIVGGASWT